MIKDSVSKVKSLFHKRKMAYCRTLNKESQEARVVLEDLAKFCRAYDSTFAPSERVSNLLEGRREVWLRIQNYLKLTPDEIYDLHQVRNKEV